MVNVAGVKGGEATKDKDDGGLQALALVDRHDLHRVAIGFQPLNVSILARRLTTPLM